MSLIVCASNGGSLRRMIIVRANAAEVSRLVRVLVGVTLALVLLSAVTVAFEDSRLHGVHKYLYVGEEYNLPTWWNSGLLLVMAMLALAVRARTAADRTGERRAWLLAAAATGYLSLDELTRLHERAGALNRLVGFSVPTFQWVLTGVVVAFLGTVVLYVTTRPLATPTRRQLGLALVMYVGAALGLEIVGGSFFIAGDKAVGVLLTHVEELVEMLAVVVGIRAVLLHAAAHDSENVPATDPGPAAEPLAGAFQGLRKTSRG